MTESSTWTYLSQPWWVEQAANPELSDNVDAAARELVDLGVTPEVVECVAERMARLGRYLDKNTTNLADITAMVVDVSPALVELLCAAFAKPRDAAEVATFALHSVDIAERMALFVYIPELPHLLAKSERTGGAARAAGAAKHLKG